MTKTLGPDAQRAAQAIVDLIKQAKHVDQFKARTGRLSTSTGEPEAGLTDPSLPSNKIWIRKNGVEPAVPAWNINKINRAAVDVVVWVGYDKNGDMEIIGPVNGDADLELGTSAQVTYTPPISGSATQLNVETLNLHPLRYELTGAYTVGVAAYRTAFYNFPGGEVDLTSYKPVTLAVWAMVSLNTKTGAFNVTTTNAVSPFFPNPDKMLETNIDDGHVFLFAALLKSTASALTADDFVDLRTLFGYHEPASFRCEGRLTLTSQTPYSLSDVTGANTLYFTNYQGDTITLPYNNRLQAFRFPQMAIDITSLTASKVYDVFVRFDGVSVGLETVAWTSDTARATALTLQKGYYVLSTNTNYVYVGSIRTDASSLCDDNLTNRAVWNYFNRLPQRLNASNAATHTVNTGGVYANWNGSALTASYLVGLDSFPFLRQITAEFKSGAGGVVAEVGVAVDAPTAITTTRVGNGSANQFRYGASTSAQSSLGYHTLYVVEYSTNSATFYQALMTGEIQC